MDQWALEKCIRRAPWNAAAQQRRDQFMFRKYKRLPRLSIHSHMPGGYDAQTIKRRRP
jgi:hypothetical protein